MSWSTSIGGTPEEIKAKAEGFKMSLVSGHAERERAQVDAVVELALSLMAKEGAERASFSIFGHAVGDAPQAGDSMGFSFSHAV